MQERNEAERRAMWPCLNVATWSAFVKFESVVGDSYSLTQLEADIVHLTSDCKAFLVWWPVIG